MSSLSACRTKHNEHISRDVEALVLDELAQKSSVVQPQSSVGNHTSSGTHRVYYDLEDLKTLANRCSRTPTTYCDKDTQHNPIIAGLSSSRRSTRQHSSIQGRREGVCQSLDHAGTHVGQVYRVVQSTSRLEPMVSPLQQRFGLMSKPSSPSFVRSDMAATIFTRRTRPLEHCDT